MYTKPLHIIIGSILGDGWLRPSRDNLKSSLELKYDDRYLSYLVWLHKMLIPLRVSPIKPHNGYHQHRFYVKLSEELGALRKLFYPKGIKIVPKEIKELLTQPISLAVWYMDDGNLDYRYKYHCSPSFATYGFTPLDCRLLVETLKNNFSLDVRIHRTTMRGKTYYRVYVSSTSTKQFFKLVGQYLLPCFRHKIPSNL